MADRKIEGSVEIISGANQNTTIDNTQIPKNSTLLTTNAPSLTSMGDTDLSVATKKYVDDHHDATKENVSNKTSSLTSNSTNTEYPGAKATYDAIENVREIAAGKGTNYVTNTTQMPALNVQDADVTVTSFKDKNGTTIALSTFKLGDNVYVTNTDVPDRWVSTTGSSSIVLSKLETAKAPITSISVNEVNVVPSNGNVDISVPKVKRFI